MKTYEVDLSKVQGKPRLYSNRPTDLYTIKQINKQRRRIYFRDRGICYWCKGIVRYADASREHLQPLGTGSWFSPRAAEMLKWDWNVALVHKACNR